MPNKKIMTAPKNEAERREFLVKYRNAIERDLGRKLTKDEISRMIHYEVSDKLRKKANENRSWSNNQYQYYVDHYAKDYNEKIKGGKRIISYFLDCSDTEEADQRNRRFLDSLTKEKGMPRFVQVILKDVLSENPNVFKGPEPGEKIEDGIEFYKKHQRNINLGYVVINDVVTDSDLKKFVSPFLVDVFKERKDLLQNGVNYDISFKFYNMDFAWLFANLPKKDIEKLNNNPFVSEAEKFNWMESKNMLSEELEQAEKLEKQMVNEMQAIDEFRNLLFAGEDKNAISRKDIEAWDKKGYLSPYMQALEDDQTVSLYQAMKDMKAGKQVQFKLRSKGEIDYIHDLLKGNERPVDKQIYNEIQNLQKNSEDVKNPEPESANTGMLEKDNEDINTDSVSASAKKWFSTGSTVKKVFVRSRKDIMTLRNELDELIYADPDMSSDFKALRNAIKENASVYPEDSSSLVQQLKNLKQAAEKYQKAKNENLYGKAYKFFHGKEAGADRFSGSGKQRYKYADLIIKVCDRHLKDLDSTIGENVYRPDLIPSPSDHVKNSYKEKIASGFENNLIEFDQQKLGQYIVLNRLSETGHSSLIENFTMQDLVDQGNMIAKTPEMKMLKEAAKDLDLGKKDLYSGYYAAKKYIEDLKTLENSSQAKKNLYKDKLVRNPIHKSKSGLLNDALKKIMLGKIQNMTKMQSKNPDSLKIEDRGLMI